jgi:LysM repeat protein
MKLRFLLLLFIILIQFQSIAQDKPLVVKSEKTELIEGKSYYMHVVGKGQTLYSISKAYDVDIALINDANPELKDGLKAGMILKIPVPGKSVPVETVQHPAVVPDTVPPIVPKPKALPQCEPKKYTESFQVSLFIPLYLGEIDSITTTDAEKAKQAANAKSLRFLQFYEGFLMAVDSIKQHGFSMKLMVYDADEDTVRMRKLLNKPEVAKSDLIIGLTYGNSFTQLANFGRKHKIPVVNPLSNKAQHIEGNPFVFLANPTVKEMAYSICTFLSDKYADDRIILVSSKKESEKKPLRMLSDGFEVVQKERNGKGPEIIDATIGATAGSISDLLSREKVNVIVLFSNDELFVADYIRRLIPIADQKDLILFGMPGWPEFQSLESANLIKLKYHSFSTTFVEYEDEKVIEFIKVFREKYKTEPADFAFQGYDIGCYFLNALFKFGKDFADCTPTYQKECLQTTFQYTHKEGEGFGNTWLNIYKYQDYKMTDARK